MQLFYGVVSVFLIYGLTGQLAALYGLVVVCMSLLCRRRKWSGSLAVFLAGVLLAYIGIRLAIGIPLTDGIYSERYQESQLQPDSYVYFIWIRFVVLLLILFATAYTMKVLPKGKRSVKVFVAGSLLVVLFCYSAFCLPGPYEVRNNRMNELSVWEQRNDWDTIIREHPEKEETDYVSLNYLNMALAQKGILGDRLFRYDQKGPQSLLASWDRTYYMSCLLSDIHYMIGDISLSEGYAMEGLTLAKRGGSPRLLQRLVKISLIRRDFALADKYLGILGRLPGYRRWAEKYAGYIRHPEKIGQDGELAAKTIPVFQPDNLLCLTGIDSLWVGHLSEPGVNRVAWEYLGCSYLLAKEMEKRNFEPLAIPYVTNVTAKYVTDIKETKALLAKQISSPVRWEESVRTMIEDGVDTFVEIGPGKTLAGFMRRIDKGVKVYNIETWEDMEKVIAELV